MNLNKSIKETRIENQDTESLALALPTVRDGFDSDPAIASLSISMALHSDIFRYSHPPVNPLALNLVCTAPCLDPVFT